MRISSISESRVILPAQARPLQSREFQYRQANYEYNQIPNAYIPNFTSRRSLVSLRQEAELLFKNNDIVNKSLLERKDELISSIKNSLQLSYLKKCLEMQFDLDKSFPVKVNNYSVYNNMASVVSSNLWDISGTHKSTKIYNSALDFAKKCAYKCPMLQLIFNANKDCQSHFLDFLGKNIEDFEYGVYMKNLGKTLWEIKSDKDAKLYIKILKKYQNRLRRLEQKVNEIFETDKIPDGKKAIFAGKDDIISNLICQYKREFLEAFDSANQEQKKQLLSNNTAGLFRLKFLKVLLNSNIDFDTTDLVKSRLASRAANSVNEVINSVRTKEDYTVKKNALQFMDKHDLSLNHVFVQNNAFQFFLTHAKNKAQQKFLNFVDKNYNELVQNNIAFMEYLDFLYINLKDENISNLYIKFLTKCLKNPSWKEYDIGKFLHAINNENNYQYSVNLLSKANGESRPYFADWYLIDGISEAREKQFFLDLYDKYGNDSRFGYLQPYITLPNVLYKIKEHPEYKTKDFSELFEEIFALQKEYDNLNGKYSENESRRIMNELNNKKYKLSSKIKEM